MGSTVTAIKVSTATVSDKGNDGDAYHGISKSGTDFGDIYAFSLWELSGNQNLIIASYQSIDKERKKG